MDVELMEEYTPVPQFVKLSHPITTIVLQQYNMMLWIGYLKIC